MFRLRCAPRQQACPTCRAVPSSVSAVRRPSLALLFFMMRCIFSYLYIFIYIVFRGNE